MTYEQYRMHLESLPRIERELTRIANCMEAAENRARRAEEARDAINPKDLGLAAYWREQVAAQETVLGYSEWLAWFLNPEDQT